MSFINNKRTNSSGGKKRSATLMPGSVSFRCVFNGTLPVKPGTHPKAPRTFSALPLDDVTIPYIFKESKSGANLITSPLSEQDAPPMVIKAGGHYVLITMFGLGSLIEGCIYRVEGAYLDAFMGERSTSPMFKVTCAQIIPLPMSYSDRMALVMDNVAFAQRSLHPDRDLPTEGSSEHLEKKNQYHFMLLHTYKQLGDNAGSLFTQKLPLGDDAQYMGSYSAYDVEAKIKLPAVPAITGGLVEDRVLPSTWAVQQNPETAGDEVKVFDFQSMLTRGLDSLQLEWSAFGQAVTPWIQGHIFAQINPKKTADLVFDQDEPAVACSTLLAADMKETSKSLGFEVTWQSACVLEPRLAQCDNLVTTAPQVCLQNQTAINLCRFNGDASFAPKLIEKGFAELRVISSQVFDPEDDAERLSELREMSQEKLLKELQKSKKTQFAVFLFATPSCPDDLYKFFSIKSKVAMSKHFEEQEGGDHKRARVEEEETG